MLRVPHVCLYSLGWNFTAQEVKSGIPVRLVNLPKKKNVNRDLKSAFQGIPGIVDIVPAVSGNKKTRDPVCKGFAFVYFKCEEDAARCVLTSNPNLNPFLNKQTRLAYSFLQVF